MTDSKNGIVREEKEDLSKPDHVEDEGSPFLDLIALILRNLRLLVVTAAAVGMLFAAFLALALRSYKAESQFLPQSAETSNLGQYAGLAAQFGVAVPNVGGESVALYAKLVRSKDLLEALGQTQFTVITDPVSGNTINGSLIELYEIEEETRSQEMLELVKRLREDLSTSVDIEAGTVDLTTRAPWPDLAEKVNARILELVQEFNVEHRQANARAQREFTSQRVEATQEALRQAENAVQEFLEQNRAISNSPELQARYARLQRRVDLQQQLYISLTQSLEQAKIDELRDLPVLTVLSSPGGSAQPTLSLPVAVLLGVFVGGAVGLVSVFIREFVREQERLQPNKMREIRRLWRSAAGRSE